MAHITFSEGSGLQDSIFGKSQAPIRRFLESRAEAFDAQSIYKEIFNVEKSNQYAEKMGGMTAMDEFQAVGENGAHPVTGMQESYSKTFEHITWKNSFSISREIMDDNKILDLRGRPQAFIQGYYRTRERYGAAILGAAMKPTANTVKFNGVSASILGADGKKLLATDHPCKVKGAAQSNAYADAFSEAALGKLETRMQNCYDDNGNTLALAPDTIIIPNDYTLKQKVFAVLGADKTTGNGNNDFNFLFGRWNVIVWSYLNQFVAGSTQVPWLLMDSNYNKTVGTAMWFDRAPLEVKSRVDDNTDANVWNGYARFVAGFNDWRGIFGGGINSGSSL